MSDDATTIAPSELLRRAMSGDEASLCRIFEAHRVRLRKMVTLRMDRRLQSRIDPSDVIQEAYVEAARRLPEYAANPVVPIYVWLRVLAAQELVNQYRRHCGAQGRDVAREMTLYSGNVPEATTAALAAQLLGKLSSPSAAAIRAERESRLNDALNQLDAHDREILALRHFEQMTNGEAAAALQLDKSTASKRYARALVKLKDILRGMPGGLNEV